MFHPEMVWSNRGMRFPNHLILEYIAWPETTDSNVLLPRVGINRGLASDGSCQILYVGRSGLDDGSIGFPYAKEFHIEFFVCRVVIEDKLPKPLHARSS